MRKRKPFNWALIIVIAIAGLLLQTASPAAALDAGAMTGWEYAPSEAEGAMACSEGPPPDPTTGFYYPSDTFVLREVGTTTDVVIVIDENVAAPQGAAPGECTGSAVVPGEIDVTSVTRGGDSCLLSEDADSTFTRVNTTVVFDITFDDDATCIPESRLVITGNMNICDIPAFPPGETITSPECDGSNLADPYPDPEEGTDDAASGHLVTAFVAI